MRLFGSHHNKCGDPFYNKSHYYKATLLRSTTMISSTTRAPLNHNHTSSLRVVVTRGRSSSLLAYASLDQTRLLSPRRDQKRLAGGFPIILTKKSQIKVD